MTARPNPAAWCAVDRDPERHAASITVVTSPKPAIMRFRRRKRTREGATPTGISLTRAPWSMRRCRSFCFLGGRDGQHHQLKRQHWEGCVRENHGGRAHQCHMPHRTPRGSLMCLFLQEWRVRRSHRMRSVSAYQRWTPKRLHSPCCSYLAPTTTRATSLRGHPTGEASEGGMG